MFQSPSGSNGPRVGVQDVGGAAEEVVQVGGGGQGDLVAFGLVAHLVAAAVHDDLQRGAELGVADGAGGEGPQAILAAMRPRGTPPRPHHAGPHPQR